MSIYVDDPESDPTQTQTTTTTESADFTSPEISIENIDPSLTRIKFESINRKKNMNVSKIIILNHLLNVQQTKFKTRKIKRNFNISTDQINTFETISIAEQSKQTSCTTLNRSTSETNVPPTSTILPRSFSLSRLFFGQLSIDTEANLVYKSTVKISYIDVSNSIRWSVKRLEFEVESEDVANELCVNLQLCLSTLTQRPSHLLAFVNPVGGKGRAPNVFEKKVLPIFKEANIIVDSICTERANHGRDYILNEDLSAYDGLICVGGDGMFAELCHGLLLRTSREANLNIDDRRVNIIRPDLKIGIVPAGSTDAVVYSTTGLNDPVTSALQIIVGESLLVDIATVHNEKGFVRFLATMLAYGFFGDIIHQSDKWRFLGPLRYDVSGFCQFVLNRSYHTELTITLPSNDSSQISQEQTLTSSVALDSTTHNHNQGNNSTEVIQNLIAPALAFCHKNCVTCASIDKNNPNRVQSSSQMKLQGRYTTINCLNMPCRCAKSKFGMSPFVHLGDGTFDLILVKRSWQTGFLRFLWQVANDGRSIEDLPNVERYRVSEVLIHPMHTDHIRLGNWACDGELISGTEIQIRIHRQALHLFASGIQFDNVGRNNPIRKTSTNIV
ncbi:hypothetical protein I4U23_021059 [Adineta vaga]|nr:hypothetical protein I4U23_021059 [Adineta vaga]